MQSNIESLSFYQYRLKVCNVELSLGNDRYTFQDGTVAYLNIYHNYGRQRLPIIMIGMELDSGTIQKYYENENTAKLKLDIYEQQYDSAGTLINTVLFLRYTFTCISAKDQSAYVTTPDQISKEMVDPMRTVQLFEAYLIDMDIVNYFAKEISLIMETPTKSALLQSIFVSRNIPSGVVMATPPVNDNTLDHPSVSLGDLIGNIDEVNAAYGLYDTKPIVYHDYKYLYCINQYKPNIIMDSATDFGNVTFVLFGSSDPAHNIAGSCTDIPSQTHYINLRTPPEILNVSAKDTSTKFSTIMTIDSNGSISKTTVDADSTKVKFVRQYHELSQRQAIHQNLYGEIVHILTSGCGVSFLRPYKQYTFDVADQYSDKNLTGHEYRMTSYSLFIHREGAEQYTHDIDIRLLRPTHDSEL